MRRSHCSSDCCSSNSSLVDSEGVFCSLLDSSLPVLRAADSAVAALADPDCLPGFADPVAQSFPAALTRFGSFAQIGYPGCLLLLLSLFGFLLFEQAPQ